MADTKQRTIIKVRVTVGHCTEFSNVQVFRKYSNSLGPETLEFVEHILNENEISEEDVESSIETLAREYNKQDGARRSFWTCCISHRCS